MYNYTINLYLYTLHLNTNLKQIHNKMIESSIIQPKLSREELKKYRDRLDRRRGVVLASEATGLSKGTINRIALAGTGSDKSIEKIRKFIAEDV